MNEYSEVQVGLQFSGGNVTRITIGPYDITDQRLQEIKANVMMFNDNIPSTACITDKDGAAFDKISEASIITVSRTRYI